MQKYAMCLTVEVKNACAHINWVTEPSDILYMIIRGEKI